MCVVLTCHMSWSSPSPCLFNLVSSIQSYNYLHLLIDNSHPGNVSLFSSESPVFPIIQSDEDSIEGCQIFRLSRMRFYLSEVSIPGSFQGISASSFDWQSIVSVPFLSLLFFLIFSSISFSFSLYTQFRLKIHFVSRQDSGNLCQHYFYLRVPFPLNQFVPFSFAEEFFLTSLSYYFSFL